MNIKFLAIVMVPGIISNEDNIPYFFQLQVNTTGVFRYQKDILKPWMNQMIAERSYIFQPVRPKSYKHG